MKLYKDHVFLGNMILIITFFLAPIIILGCCTPEKPVAIVHPFKSYDAELHLRGFDTNCDGDIDYWQHYNSHGNKVGSPIWVKRK